MLESLHRRPRGRLAGRMLELLGLTGPPTVHWRWVDGRPCILLDPRERTIGTADPGPGLVTRSLGARLGPDADGELAARLDAETRPLWEAAGPDRRAYLRLALSLHHRVPEAAERTGLRADEPPAGVHAMARGPVAAGGSSYHADLVVEALEHAGVELGDGLRVLDFGCSSGRVTRVLAAYEPRAAWHGCDPIAPAVEWASRHVPGVEFRVSPEQPPLPYGDAAFDAVYAISIWSHFSPASALLWFDEMRRVLAPGGVLVVTTQGWHTTHHLARSGLWSPGDVARTIAELYDRGASFTRTFERRSDHGLQSTEWGMGFQSPEWLLTHLSPRWHVVSFAPGRSEGSQDVVVLRRTAPDRGAADAHRPAA